MMLLEALGVPGCVAAYRFHRVNPGPRPPQPVIEVRVYSDGRDPMIQWPGRPPRAMTTPEIQIYAQGFGDWGWLPDADDVGWA